MDGNSLLLKMSCQGGGRRGQLPPSQLVIYHLIFLVLTTQCECSLCQRHVKWGLGGAVQHAPGQPPSFSNSHGAPAVSNFISFTSFTKGVSVYKTRANATLTTSAGTKPQSSDLGVAMKDESSRWDWRSEARVWMMLSSAFSRTGGGIGSWRPRVRTWWDGGWSLSEGWANLIPVWYTLICALHLSPDCEREGRWAGTCQTLYGMRRLFINH